MAIENGFDLPAQAAFDLIKSVYGSTDAFAGEFEQDYPSVPALAAHLAEIRVRPGSLFLVCREAEALLGYLFVVPRGANKLRHTADLNMGVRAGARGKGVGSALLDAALARLRAQSIIEIAYLMVRADNRPAIGLYAKLGFSLLARLERDTKIGSRYHDGVLMRIQLTDPRPPLKAINPKASGEPPGDTL